MLSPHAELSSTSKTSAALTALLALLLLSAGPGPSCSSPGLAGRLRADANCHSASAGGENGLGPGDVRVGEAVGVCCIELARLLGPILVSRCGGVAARAKPPCVFVSAGVNSELALGE